MHLKKEISGYRGTCTCKQCDNSEISGKRDLGFE